ncbi:MAG: restriction endonuclease subunit S [Clostridia bacterium]|nr:restriction endonuclease subunit S [Clostridia bacterium]
MEQYVQMKNSGVSWIQDIPVSWGVRVLFQLADQVKNKNKDLAEKNLLSLSYGKIKRKNIDSPEGLLPESFDGYNIIEADDIVLRLTDLQNDHTSLRVGQAKERGIITSAYTTLRPSGLINPKYLYYVLHAYDLIKGFYGMGSGVRQGLNYDEVKTIKIPYPPLSEQNRIVTYLENQVAQIDSIIDEAKGSIEDYGAWRKAVVSESVTKGLHPDVPMKETGISWLGEIPSNWHFVKITRLLDYNHPYPIGDGDHGLVKPSDYLDSGIPYIRVQNVGWGTEITLDNVVYISEETNTRIVNSTLRPNDILFAKTGATIGKTGIMPNSIPIANTTSHVGKITISANYNPKYALYVLSSKIGFNQFWEAAGKKTTRPELSIDEIKAIKVLLPPTKTEQNEIVEFLDQKIAEIDSMVVEKQEVIADLEAYKRSLIYDAVTGKQKVV